MNTIRLFLSVFIFVLCTTPLLSQRNDQTETLRDYYGDKILPATVIIKVKPGFRSQCTAKEINLPRLNRVFSRLSVSHIAKKFPQHDGISNKGKGKVDLSLIYSLQYEEAIEESKAIAMLMESKVLEYASPHIVPRLAYTPSDTGLSNQYYIGRINAYNAWNTQKGDTNVVIAYTDTGWDTSHTDLKNNVKYNYNDPVNGTDDDGDGYTDNYAGWDVAMNDNNAHWEGLAHGVSTTGIGSASTDNTTGIAGVGFQCRFLPVKISNSAAVLTHAYEGIVYAADQGCDVINCSWGSRTPSPYGRDVVNYATYNKGSLVIGAVGNDSLEIKFYPAAYESVMAVTASDQNDKKKGNSNWGYYVDVSAPGEDMFTTDAMNGYRTNGGTSMAAPVAAAAAGIVKSQFPSYTPIQIREQLKATAVDIDALNPNYAGKIGEGRIDLNQALTASSTPAVVATGIIASDGKGNAFDNGDTITITADYINYLSGASGLNASLSSTSSHVNIIDANTAIGSLNTLDTMNSTGDPFKVIVQSGAPEDFTVTFKIQITDGSSYSKDQYFDFTINRTYLNITAAKLKTTITSISRIGYNDTQLTEGIGVLYNSTSSMLYEGGFMVGDNTSRVADAVRGPSGPNEDFTSLVQVHHDAIPDADQELSGLMEDFNLDNRMNVFVGYHAYAYSTSPNNDYVILTYKITNNSSVALNNLYAGIFTDWDIKEFSDNRSGTDPSRKLGYSFYGLDSSLYAGVQVLSNTGFSHYALDLEPGGGGGIDITSGYSEEKKYNTLMQNRNTAGNILLNGNDVANVVATGPFSLNPGESMDIGFAIIGGNSLSQLQAAADSAQLKYDTEPLSATLHSQAEESINVYPVPAKDRIYVRYHTEEIKTLNYSIIDLTGKVVKKEQELKLKKGENKFHIEVSDLHQGLYFINFQSKGKKINRKIIIE